MFPHGAQFFSREASARCPARRTQDSTAPLGQAVQKTRVELCECPGFCFRSRPPPSGRETLFDCAKVRGRRSSRHSAEIGTIRLVALSKGTVARLLVVLLALLALAGCDWAGQARERSVETTGGATGTASTPTPAPVVSSPTERVIEAIRTCGVKSIVFARGERTYITFRGGRTVRSKRLNRDKISRVAYGRAKACNIVIGTELVEETPCPIRVLAGRLVALCPLAPSEGRGLPLVRSHAADSRLPERAGTSPER